MLQAAGIHPNLDFRSIGWEETKIIKNLAQLWFITFVRAASFKASDYIFAFAKPTSTLTERFHLEREMLVLFTPYESFEPRALDFVDKTIFEFQNRLDKLCVVLISRDSEVRDRISSMTMEDPELRIVIPFEYNELLNLTSVNLVENRLKEFFYGRDLFAYSSPLHSDNYFFGRGAIVQRCYDKYKSGQNAGLFGLRKTGKTSVLYALMRYLNFREEPVIFLDCEEPAFHARRWYGALQFIIESLVRVFQIPSAVKLNILGSYDKENASLCFEEDLSSISGHLGQGRILLIFDEIENITFGISPSKHWTEENDFILFWQSVRSVFQKNPNLFCFVIAGVNARCIETGQVNNYDNPIYRLAISEYLSVFDVSQVREMVTSIGRYMGLQFDEEVFTYLAEDYGGHPFLIRQVCSYLHNNAPRQRPFTITKFRYKEEQSNVAKILNDYIVLILDVLKTRYEDEYELLMRLAAGDVGTFNESARTLYDTVQHLEGYGLVAEDNGKYYFRIKAVEAYLKSTSDLSKIQIPGDKASRWQEVTSRRNELEIKLKKIVHFGLVSHYGVKAESTFLEIIEGKRKSRLLALNFQEIFDSNKGELYLEDLRKTISKHWDKFGQLFGKDKEYFDLYMKHINTHRIDAHAKDIDDQSYAALMMAFAWFEHHTNQLLF